MVKTKRMSVSHKFMVKGIHCINCVNGIKTHLQKKNLTKVHIELSNGLVTVYDSSIESDTIQGFIEELGYTSKVYNPNKNEHSKLNYYLIISSFLSIPLLAHMFVSEHNILQNPFLQVALATPVLIIGYIHFFKSAYRSVLNLKPNMNVLILMGATAAYLYSIIGWLLNFNAVHQYLFFETSATIITLVLLGNYFEKRAINQTTTSLKSLQNLQSKTTFKEVNGERIACLIEELNIGDVIAVNLGDSVPIDGEIIWGNCSIDESMITGESSSVYRNVSDKVVGGTLITEGSIKIRVSSKLNDTVLSTIIELVRSAQENKPQIQKLGDRISNVFVPIVLLIGIVSFVLNYLVFGIVLQESVLRAIAVLVISCPCAMGLATPTAVMVGVGRAAKNGILIKGGATLELLSKITTVVFDKTGTLTNGKFSVKELCVLDKSYPIEAIIYGLEKHSNHPIALSLCNEFNSFNQNLIFEDIKEIKGQGLEALDKDQNLYKLGSAAYLNLVDEKYYENYQLFLSVNHKLVACILIQDKVMNDAVTLISFFNSNKINTVLLSGDTQLKCNAISKELGIQKVYAAQSPEDKIEKIKQFTTKGKTAMFGDGVNDAPALTQATVGISYTKASEIAVKSASIVLLNHNLKSVKMAYQICKHTYRTIQQNLFWAFAYNIVAIPLAASGYLNPIFAAFTMALSDIIVIGNSIRLKYKNIES